MVDKNSLANSEHLKVYRRFSYRLNPSQDQKKKILQFAGCARFVYNWALARSEENHKKGIRFSVFNLNRELTKLKEQPEHSWLAKSHAQMLQQSIGNLGVAFSRFFQKKADYPKFKKRGQRDSFCFPQQFKVLENQTRLYLPKIGYVKYRQDRKIQGDPKSITVYCHAGHWFASVLCEIEIERKSNSGTAIGLDVGIARFLTTWDGSLPRTYQHSSRLEVEYDKLAKLHRKLSRKEKRSKNRHKARLKVARQYYRISCIRKDTLHKLSSDLCKNHAVIGIENLKVSNMMKSASGTLEQPGKKVAQKRGLNRSISRQGWRELRGMLEYKTVLHGSKLVPVPPAYTSQACPCCATIDFKNRLTQTSFVCVSCGYRNNADIVGAMNVRHLALQLAA